MKRLPMLGLQRLALREFAPRDAYGRFVSAKQRGHRRGRRNPVLSKEAFNKKVEAFEKELNEKHIGLIIRGLRKAGVAVPDGRAVNAGIRQLAMVMAAAGEVELANQSRLDDPAEDVVDESLGFVADGAWRSVLDKPEIVSIVEPHLRELSKRLEILRIPALNARKDLGLSPPEPEEDEDDLDEAFAEEVLGDEAEDEDEEPEKVPPPKKPKSGKKAKTEEDKAAKKAKAEEDKDARMKRVADRLKKRSEKLKEQLAGLQDEDEDVDVEEDIDIEEEEVEDTPKRGSFRQGDGRVRPEQVIETVRVAQGRAVLREDCKADLEGFKRFEATRRSPIRPSAAVLEATKKDVLLFMLQDRTTQVWAKGAITVTFAAPGQGLSSIQKASQYAKIWRECKKSRHECRIVVGVEGSDEYLVKAPALVGPASAGANIDLASVGKAAGIGEKSNPRRNGRARQVSAAAFWPKALRNLRIRTPDRELASFIRNPLR